MRAYHFVKRKTLKAIQKSGFLQPTTSFFQDAEDKRLYGEPVGVFRKATLGKYTCAIPKSRFHSWIKSRFTQELEFFFKPKYVLEFNIPPGLHFVREHVMTSPVAMQKLGVKWFREVPRKQKLAIWKRYLKSSKRLSNKVKFRGIKVPELWVAAKVPMSSVKVITIAQFKRKTSW